MSIILFLVLTFAGTYFVRLRILEKHMSVAMDMDDRATVVGLAQSFPSPVNARDIGWRTPLHRAAEWGDRALVELLLRKGADIQSKDSFGWTPLHHAAGEAQKEVVELLVANGAEVSAKTDDGRTPLHAAAGGGGTAVVEFLIAKGADINGKDNMGRTPLHEAAEHGCRETVELLIAKGADIRARDSDGDGKTPLDQAALEGNREVAQLLIAKGAVINANKAVQAEILKKAIESVHFDDSAVELASWIHTLVSWGIDVNVKDADGNTALLIAADNLHRPFPVFKALLGAGADVNAQDQDGDTALHMVLREGELDIDAVKLLIDAGINVTATNKMGDIAFLDVAWLLDDEDAAAETDANHKPNTQLVAARLLLAAGAGKWENYMGRPVTVVPGPPAAIDPIVSKLALPDARNEAFRTVISWQKYRTKPSAPEREYKPLRHVVVCPQKTGPPIYAVFPWTSYEQREAPKGHVILVDADGAIIPYYLNANWIDDQSEFKDVNGDGVIDEVHIIHFHGADVLHVLPMTRDQCPILNIVLKLKKKRGSRETEWSWRLVGTATPNVFSIEIGPLNAKSEEIIPRARYEWSKEKKEYVGPPGGGEFPFMRLNAPSPSDSAEYESFVPTEKEQR